MSYDAFYWKVKFLIISLDIVLELCHYDQCFTRNAVFFKNEASDDEHQHFFLQLHTAENQYESGLCNTCGYCTFYQLFDVHLVKTNPNPLCVCVRTCSHARQRSSSGGRLGPAAPPLTAQWSLSPLMSPHSPHVDLSTAATS